MKAERTILSLPVTLLLLSLYLLVSIPGLYNHELWLDEAQHFLIGRDSHSLSDLYWNMRYDGHPRLWNILLYLVTHYISVHYAGLQVLHLLVTSAALYIFLRYAPFSLPMKLLIGCGYYFLFEYNVLSRNYALGIFFLFVCCTQLGDPVRNKWRIGLLLLLLCNAHLFFAFSAIGIFVYLFPGWSALKKGWENGMGPVFVFFGIAILMACVQSMTPAEDNCYQVHPSQWLSTGSLSFAGMAIVKGWLPIPRPGASGFWNTYWVDNLFGPLKLVLTLFFIVFPGAFWWNRKRIWLLYYGSLLPLLAFFIVSHMSGSRYFGMVYINFIAACWVAGNAGSDAFAFMPVNKIIRLSLLSMLVMVLVIHGSIGIYALSQDFSRPFSESRNTIDYIKERGLEDQKIVVDGYNAGPVLAAYLGRQVYYLDIGQMGSYCYWRRSYFPVPRQTIGQEMAASAMLQQLKIFILISNRPLNKQTVRVGNVIFRILPLTCFTGGMIGSENYWIYQVSREGSSSYLNTPV